MKIPFKLILAGLMLAGLSACTQAGQVSTNNEEATVLLQSLDEDGRPIDDPLWQDDNAQVPVPGVIDNDDAVQPDPQPPVVIPPVGEIPPISPSEPLTKVGNCGSNFGWRGHPKEDGDELSGKLQIKVDAQGNVTGQIFYYSLYDGAITLPYALTGRCLAHPTKDYSILEIYISDKKVRHEFYVLKSGYLSGWMTIYEVGQFTGYKY